MTPWRENWPSDGQTISSATFAKTARRSKRLHARKATVDRVQQADRLVSCAPATRCPNLKPLFASFLRAKSRPSLY
ncbi:30S ribosomal protein S17 [Thalassospira sp. MCCC 1A02803]|nr:30S ribosomal protein S17 [Thalassospira sp. MCCC 1A02803]